MLRELLNILSEAENIIEDLDQDRESLKEVFNDLKDIDQTIDQH